MNPVIWLGLCASLVLLVWDWVTKRRRIIRRSDVTDHEFLALYRGDKPTPRDALILDVRNRIARELALPAEKLLPGDHLTTLRDRYCLAVGGHLALSDLVDDLIALEPASSADPVSRLETVADYIAAYMDRTTTARELEVIR